MMEPRKLWHDLVDRSIAAAVANRRPLNAEKLLDAVGIFAWATSRPAALEYVNKQLCAHTKARKGKP
jgi:hypothetical protein